MVTTWVQIPASAFSDCYKTTSGASRFCSPKIIPSGFEPYQSRAANGVSEHVWFRFKSQPAHTCELFVEQSPRPPIDRPFQSLPFPRRVFQLPKRFFAREEIDDRNVLDISRNEVVADKHRDESWEAP